MSEQTARLILHERIAEKAAIKTVDDVNLDKPPGFVGEMADWIESQSLFDRKKLSVLSALSVASSVSSIHFTDELGTIPNIMAFGVADSATGKESVQSAHKELLIAAGLGCCVYGGIKSSAEIIRNIISHQPCIYVIDEFGKKLEKIIRSEKGGGSDYLATVIAELMQIYSNSKSTYVLHGDDRKKIANDFHKRIAAENKKLDKGVEGCESRINYYLEQLNHFSDGVRDPLLTLTGYTTGQTFSHLMTHDMVTSGFLGRCLLAIEKESNPPRKRGFRKIPMPENFGITLKSMVNLGTQSAIEDYRLQFYGTRTIIKYDEDAELFREEMLDWFIDDKAEICKNNDSNLEAVARRSCEIMLKIALCLGAFEGRITLKMIKWAAKFAQKDFDSKSIMVMSNSKTKGMRGKILSKLNGSKPVRESFLINRCGGLAKSEEIREALSILVRGKIVEKINLPDKRDNLTLVPHYKFLG